MELMANTPGLAIVVMRVKSIGSTPTGLKEPPQPGDSGSVGAPITLPAASRGAWMLYWVPRMPFEVNSEAKRMAGVRLQNRPAEKRRAVFSSGAQEIPKRGEIWLLASGMCPVRLNEPLALRSFGLSTGASGLFRRS